MIPLLWIAGLLQLGIAAANVGLSRVLRLDVEFGRLRPIARDIARAHHAYIVGVLVFAGLLCLGFAPELASGSPLAAFLCGGLALFWGARLVLQGVRYDPAVRRRYRGADVLFTLAAAGLAGVFIAGVVRFIGAAAAWRLSGCGSPAACCEGCAVTRPTPSPRACGCRPRS